MNRGWTLRASAGAGAAAGCLAVAAVGAQAQVKRFEIVATSPTTVRVGQAVGFTTTLVVEKTAAVDELIPGDPEPAAGVEFWMQGQRLRSDTALALSLSLQGTDGQFGGSLDFGAGYGDPGPAAGVLHGSLSFASPGRYGVDAFTLYSGAFAWSIASTTAQRSCTGDAASGYVCTPWVVGESLSEDRHNFETGFGSFSGPITITVVPEPLPVALWLAGLGVVGLLARRRPGPASGAAAPTGSRR